jgi:hypothetical protein
MTMKTHSQRSISDLERSIKDKVLSHRNHDADTWIEMNHLLQNHARISVYCDCSVSDGYFHLGICIVGLGTCRLYGSSIVTQFPQYTVLGELHALRFAIDCVREFLGSNGVNTELQSIYVFTDVDHIERLLGTNSQRAHKSIRKSVRRLRRSIKRFNKQSTELTLGVCYVGKPNERNLYYRSAHQVARHVAGLQSRRVNKGSERNPLPPV